ncbi:MAG: hypothetical protein ACO1OT_06570 [Heyndrickxia sp.]
MRKNIKLRMAYIILNLFCYSMLIGFSTFVVKNANGLADIGELSKWVLMMFLLLLVCVFETYSIRKWIKEGKL